MATPFLGRYILFNAVGKEYHTYLVIVLYGTESKCGSYLGDHVTLSLTDGSEIERTAHIHKQHHREFTLFFKHFDIRAVEASRHIPVNIAHIITKLIFPHFGEGHASSLKGRMILSGKDVLTKPAGLNLDFPDFL